MERVVKGKLSSAGEIFDLSAAAIRPMEACALLLGQSIDEVRTITVMPLTAEGREIAIAAFRMLGKFDSVRADLETSLIELRRCTDRIAVALQRRQFNHDRTSC